MCSRELLVKNVPHPSSVFEHTINPHSSNAYIAPIIQPVLAFLALFQLRMVPE